MVKQTESLKQRTLAGVSWSFVDNASQQILSFLIFMVLGRILSPSLFGILSTSLIFVNLLRNMALNAIATGLIMLRDPVDEDYDTGFLLCLIISSFGCVIANILAPWIAKLYGLGTFEGVIRATSIILLVSGMGYAHAGWAKKNFLFRSLAMRDTISTGIGGAVGIALAFLGYGIAALVVNQIVASVLGLALLWRVIPWRPRWRFSAQRARNILAIAGPLGGTQTLQFITQNFDTVLVTYLLGPLNGGFYAASKRVVLAIQIALWQPMAAVALPALAEVAHDPRRLNNAAARMAALVMATTAPLFAGLALTAPMTIVTLFGPKWAAAAATLSVLASFSVIAPSLNLLQTLAIALKHSKFVLVSTLSQMALSLIGIYIWGHQGAVSIALCISAPSLINYVGMLLILPLRTPLALKQYFRAIVRPLLCTALMGLAVWSVPDLHFGPGVQLILAIIVGSLAYLAAAALLLQDTIREFSGPAARIWGGCRSRAVCKRMLDKVDCFRADVRQTSRHASRIANFMIVSPPKHVSNELICG